MCLWLPIKNYEDLYEVSSEGEVRNIRTKHTLKPRTNNKGYMLVTLGPRTERKAYLVHRLVAMTHIPNPKGLPEVNHKDEDKTNLRVDNLEWMTHQENSEYTLAKTYTVVSPRGKVHTIYNLNKFCRENNYHVVGFWRMVSGKRKQYKGWRLYHE